MQAGGGGGPRGRALRELHQDQAIFLQYRTRTSTWYCTVGTGTMQSFLLVGERNDIIFMNTGRSSRLTSSLDELFRVTTTAIFCGAHWNS